MKTLETTQFTSSTATANHEGATSLIERSIINSRSKTVTNRGGGFVAASSVIRNSSISNRSTKSTAFWAEAETTGATGLSTSRIVNRGEIFAIQSGDVQMENNYFINARSGGFKVTVDNIRGIADETETAETGNWKISNYQTGAVRKAA